MAKSKANRILETINNDPELLAIYETGFIGQQEELVSKFETFVPHYGTQSFQQGIHTYQFEIASTPDGSAQFTGRVS